MRHHLSLNRLFERQPRPPSDPGFGSYWTVNLDAPPGTKRPRKRGRNNKTADNANNANNHAANDGVPVTALGPPHTNVLPMRVQPPPLPTLPVPPLTHPSPHPPPPPSATPSVASTVVSLSPNPASISSGSASPALRQPPHSSQPPSPAEQDRKSTRLNSSHSGESRMPSSA